ncbi:MAG: hypothetical protein ACLVK8_09535, partial [Ruminococcus sp.]
MLHTAFVIFAVIIALKLVDFSQYDRILNSQKKPKKKIATLLFSWYNRRGLMQKAAAAQESAAVCIRAENFMQPDTLHRIFRQQCSLFYGEKCRNRRFPAQFLEPVTEIFRKSHERNDLLGTMMQRVELHPKEHTLCLRKISALISELQIRWYI